MLQTQNLRVDQVNKPYIGLTQKNSMEFLVQIVYLKYSTR